MTQAELDNSLDRLHTINVVVSPDGRLPVANHAYDAIRPLEQTGFSVTPRKLLHAIGCKTASLPVSEQDECLKAAWLYTYILDLQGPYLSFQGLYGSDLQTARSQEIGIGFMCLIADRYFGIPWDQLGSLPGRGKRFDYHGTTGTLNCIFESKGTSHSANQPVQIDNGLEKKEAHHQRNEHFDVELIVSSLIGHGRVPPNILLADPDKSSLIELFDRGDKRYYRLKHYCRVLQFIGLPRSAYHLNRYALDYLAGRRLLYRTIMDEKHDEGFLEKVIVEGDLFLGRWFETWLPKDSKRYKRLYDRDKEIRSPVSVGKRYVFQGLRQDIYRAGLSHEPFLHDLLAKQEMAKYQYAGNARVSVFADGTIMAFREEE